MFIDSVCLGGAKEKSKCFLYAFNISMKGYPKKIIG